MKEKNPQYVLNKRKNTKIATRCRVCGGQLMLPNEIKNDIHDKCDNDDKNVYMM